MLTPALAGPLHETITNTAAHSSSKIKEKKKKTGIFFLFSETDQFNNLKSSSAGLRKVLQPRAKGVKEIENGKD